MKKLKLKNPIELGEMIKSESETFNYIEELHMTLKDYQIVFDAAIDKNRNINKE